MIHKGTVTLETERLILRPFIPSDIYQIFNNCWSEFDVWKWTLYMPMNKVDDVIKTLECLQTNGLALTNFLIGIAGN